MNNIQNQLITNSSRPFGAGFGEKSKNRWPDSVNPAPGSELERLWNDPTTYPVGLIKLSLDELIVIFERGRELRHTFTTIVDGKSVKITDSVNLHDLIDKRLGKRVIIVGKRVIDNGKRECEWQLTDSELRVFEGLDPRTSNDDVSTYRPFLDKEGKFVWQLLRRDVKVKHIFQPDPETVPAYLNYLFQNLSRAIGDGLYDESLDDETCMRVDEIEGEFSGAALEHHPLGVYNFIPTDPSLINWFFSIKAEIAAGALDHAGKDLDEVTELVKRWGGEFASLTEPFVLAAVRNSRALKREIDRQDREGSDHDEELDDH